MPVLHMFKDTLSLDVVSICMIFFQVFYMLMVLSFCAVLASRIQQRHFAFEIPWLLWISFYELGEVVTRIQVLI